MATFNAQSVVASAVLEVRTYAHSAGGDPSDPQQPKTHDLSDLPFSTDPNGLTYGLVATQTQNTKKDWGLILNGTPPPAGSPAGTPNSGGLVNIRAAQQQVLDGTPATSTTPAVVGLYAKEATAHGTYTTALAALPDLRTAALNYYAPIDAARQEVAHAQINLAYQQKFGDAAAQGLAQARLDAANDALQNAQQAPPTAVDAYVAGQATLTTASVAWKDAQSQVTLQEELVARIDAQITIVAGYQANGPDDPTTDNPNPPPAYVAYLLGVGGNGLIGAATSGTVASSTYTAHIYKTYKYPYHEPAPGDPPVPDPEDYAPRCEINYIGWDKFGVVSGEYQFQFSLAESDIAALKQAGFTSVRLVWDELTVRYLLKTTFVPSQMHSDCPDYPVVARDPSQPPQLTSTPMSETLSLDAGVPVIVGQLKSRAFVSSLHTASVAGLSNVYDTEIQVVIHRMPGTEIQIERQGASIQRVGFAEYTTNESTPADEVNYYRTETAGGPGFFGARRLSDPTLQPPAFPTEYTVDPSFPLGELEVFADYPGSGVRVPTDTGMTALSPTQRTGTSADGRALTLTLSDQIDPSELSDAVDAIAALAWIDDPPPPNPDGSSNLPVGYGNVADNTLTALCALSPNGSRYAAQKARYKWSYSQLPTYPLPDQPIAYRLKRTTWQQGRSEKQVDYIDVTATPTAQQIASGEIPGPADWTEVGVPGQGTTILIEGCLVEDTSDPHSQIILGSYAQVMPASGSGGG